MLLAISSRHPSPLGTSCDSAVHNPQATTTSPSLTARVESMVDMASREIPSLPIPSPRIIIILWLTRFLLWALLSTRSSGARQISHSMPHSHRLHRIDDFSSLVAYIPISPSSAKPRAGGRCHKRMGLIVRSLRGSLKESPSEDKIVDDEKNNDHFVDRGLRFAGVAR